MRTKILAMAFMAAAAANAAWYWPFGKDEDDENAPVRLHRLLEPANEYIDTAEDYALDGDADKALENYKLALRELDRIESENPERADTPEFAPLRNRRAACTAAIDSIRFAQIRDNKRLMTVTDTAELQKKWERKHGIQTAETAAATPTPAPAPEPAPAAEKPSVAAPSPAPAPAPAPKAETPRPAVAAASAGKLRQVAAQNKDAVAAMLKSGSAEERRKMAVKCLKDKDYVAADLLLESALAETPDDLNALLLRSAAQAGMESNFAARRTLEKAMRAHPGAYQPYYNLASLTIKMGGPKVTARQYYELGKRNGGPVNKALEEMLGSGN